MFFSLPFGTQLALLYLLAINLVSSVFILLDKAAARHGRARTPESLLWFLALLGGTLGTFCAMHLARHKTKKISFQLVLALIFLLHLAAIVLYTRYPFHATL